MIGNAERFKNICSGIQSISIAAAAVVGGGWALYVFNAELRVENAQMELRKLERELAAEAALEIALEIKQVSFPEQVPIADEQERFLSILVTLKNHGNRPTAVDMSSGPLRVTYVELDDVNNKTFGRTVLGYKFATSPEESNEILRIDQENVRVGDVDRIPFFVSVDKPGLYLVEFVGGLTAEEKARSVESGVDPDLSTAWTAKEYFVVR